MYLLQYILYISTKYDVRYKYYDYIILYHYIIKLGSNIADISKKCYYCPYQSRTRTSITTTKKQLEGECDGILPGMKAWDVLRIRGKKNRGMIFREKNRRRNRENDFRVKALAWLCSSNWLKYQYHYQEQSSQVFHPSHPCRVYYARQTLSP